MKLIESPQELARAFGFEIPESVAALTRILNQHLVDPVASLEELNLADVEDGPLAGNVAEAHWSPSVPVEVHRLSGTGTDGGVFGFVVDDRDALYDRPFVECYPDESANHRWDYLLEALQMLTIFRMREDEHEWLPRNRDLAEALREFARMSSPSLPEGLIKARTTDGCGVFLPRGSYDPRRGLSEEWDASFEDLDVDGGLRLLDAAESLMSSEPGSALVIARNVRHLQWGADWLAERAVLPRTADILTEAYRALDRDWLIPRLEEQTSWAIANIR